MKRLCHPGLRVDSDRSTGRPNSVSICDLDPDFVASLASCAGVDKLVKAIFRVTVALSPPEDDGLPDVSGHYLLYEDEVQFIPHFPFERGLKYRAVFDAGMLGLPTKEEPLDVDFLIPSDPKTAALTKVTHIFPSCDVLPENLLRFYVCFSNSMQRGRALEEISLLDSDGQPVADSLYRPPFELWDRTMRHLTVLLDPGRLKRFVGPNIELGPPLKAGQHYTLEIGSGMTDVHGRPLTKRFRKHFLVGAPVRKHISVNSWRVLLPLAGSRQTLVIVFTSPLDWALLLQTITIGSADGSVIEGQVAVDQCERRWNFTPASAWVAGVYNIRVGSSLEDVCGNSITGAFDRPLRKSPDLVAKTTGSSLTFQLI